MIRILYVDNDSALRSRYVRNLKSELRKVLGDSVEIEECAEIEDAREVIDERGAEFSVVICDLLFAPLERPDAPEEEHEPRGLDLVALAHDTTDAVVVALSVGNHRKYPFLERDAETRGASIVRLKAMVHDASRYGWSGLAKDIQEHLASRSHNPLQRVFIVHGRDPRSYREQLARLIERATPLEALILDEQPNRGLTLIDKFKAHARGDCIAIILMTGDDLAFPEGEDPSTAKRRPRQNVILELGYFLGTLAPERTIVLREADIESPSDIAGVTYYELNPTWKTKVAKELQALGVEVDLTKVT